MDKHDALWDLAFNSPGDFNIFSSLKENWVNLIPVEVLLKLFEDENLPDWATSTLAEAEIARRKAIAIHPNTAIAILTQLAQDPNAEVRKAIAGNPNTPESVLTLLVGDPDGDVKQTARTTLDRINTNG